MGTGRSAEVLIAEPPARRRYRSKRERRQIVEETLQPGASVAVIARRHDVNANQVFHWRKLYREGRLDVPAAAQLLPVRVAEVVSSEPPPPRCYAGVIVVEVGRARIRIEGTVDADNLRVVLERVGR
jgi:transposase